MIDSYAMKILDTFKIPYRIAGGEQYLASSIGIAVYPKDGKNSTEVIAAADHAMYKVKKNGKNSRAFYDAGMEKEPGKRYMLYFPDEPASIKQKR